MSKPLFPNNGIFSPDQTVCGRVTVWDTRFTGGLLPSGDEFVSNGIIYRPATAESTFGVDFDFTTASLTTLHAHFDAHTTPGLVDESGDEVYGRVPVIHDYWGAGAPVGVSTANRTALRYKGYVRTSGTYAIVFTGAGNIRAFQNGSPINLLTSETVGTLPPNLAFRRYTAGDSIEIFFWAVDVPWGGISCHVTSNPQILDTQYGLVWPVLREEPFLAAGWMDDGVVVQSEVLEDVSSTTVSIRRGQAPELVVELATGPDEVTGWTYDAQLNTVTHNGTSFVVKIGQRIRLEGGFDDVLSKEFTGMIDDIVPGRKTIAIKCVGFERRLVRQISENYPDRLSYSAYGYTNHRGVSEPVWNVPAYDNWPFEHAITDLCLRAWIDPSLLGGHRRLIRVGQSSEEAGSPLFRCRSLGGKLLRVPRQAHYGNPEGDPDRAPDDPYTATSEITKTLYARIQDLIKKVGYEFFTNAWGEVCLRPSNNPDTLVQITTGGTEAINPSAIGAKYRKLTGNSWSWSQSGIKAGRIDLVVGKAPGLGTISVTVTRAEDGETFASEIDLDAAVEWFYYDDVTTADGSNTCAVTILAGEEYGTYTVSVVPKGADADTEFRLDALRVFEQDPSKPHPQFSLDTLSNVLEATPRSNTVDRLNDAIVTGKLQNTITDSDKMRQLVEREFVVSRTSDPHSILDPTAVNYLGGRITAFLSDESIAEQSLADWTSKTLVYEYRLPKPDGSVRHTAIPVLELGDPVYVTESQAATFDGQTVMWVTGFETRYEWGTKASAVTTMELTPFAAVPSYEPAEEIDISLFNNKPVINLSIGYPSLSGGGKTVLNPGPTAVAYVSGRESVTAVVSNGGIGIPADTWSPGSELLLAANKPYRNFPYFHYYERTGPTEVTFQAAGPYTHDVYERSWYHCANGETVNLSYIKIIDAYSGCSPFYDPYYSEQTPPRLISIGFDALVSGYYRVSVVDARGTELPVAWLTEPGTTDPSPKKHWTYLSVGKGKTFKWDGVDNIGSWNRRQTDDTLTTLKGAFPEIADRFRIGAGFYAANDRMSGLAHISGEVVDGLVAYPVGRYGHFYVKVECIRDESDTVYLVRSSRGGDARDLFDSAAQPISSRYIYTHIHPQPNRVTTDILDWSAEGGFDPAAGGTTWETSADTDATFRDDKPVCVRLTAVQRVGAAFKNLQPAVKVHRVAHLTAVAFDEAVIALGQPWNTKSTTEEKRVVSRRTANDKHTLVFKDPTFTPGDELNDWIFYPALFEDDFGNGVEAIRYLDYTQLFEVPNWNPNRLVGEARSRFLVGLMGYLFYLSVFTQDRSGRLAWSVDPTHVDRSKILNKAGGMEFPFDLERHQRRVIYTRQWWDSNLLEQELGPWSVPASLRGMYSDRLNPDDTNTQSPLYPLNGGTQQLGAIVTAYRDPYTEQLKTIQSKPYLPSFWNTDRELGTVSGTVATALGAWTWENPDGILWIPNLTRDFHPYYVVPPMSWPGRMYTDKWYNYWERNYVLAVTNQKMRNVDGKSSNRAADPAQYDTWFAMALTRDHASELYKDPGYFCPGINVKSASLDGKGNPIEVPAYFVDVQHIDELVRYEECRGAISNGPNPGRDLIVKAGGDPYYLNPVRYRHFRKAVTGNYPNPHVEHMDVHERHWFDLTFRHTYCWESPSLFPVLGLYRKFAPQAIDLDLTGFNLGASNPTGKNYAKLRQSDEILAYDPGAWAGWKDDHPSLMQNPGSFPDSGTCSVIHWRYDQSGAGNPGVCGGSCADDDASQQLEYEDWVVSRYDANANLFIYNCPPFAVGPRLPETRRVLLALTLVNERRAEPIQL